MLENLSEGRNHEKPYRMPALDFKRCGLFFNASGCRPSRPGYPPEFLRVLGVSKLVSMAFDAVVEARRDSGVGRACRAGLALLQTLPGRGPRRDSSALAAASRAVTAV